MKINMTNLNVFRRLSELETDNLYLRTLLKIARADIEDLTKTREAQEWAAKLRQDVLNAGKLMK
jgi:hypothetical protein